MRLARPKTAKEWLAVTQRSPRTRFRPWDARVAISGRKTRASGLLESSGACLSHPGVLEASNVALPILTNYSSLRRLTLGPWRVS